jgi:hypothetical protein
MPEIQVSTIDDVADGSELQALEDELGALVGYVARRKDLICVRKVGGAVAEAERHVADARLRLPDVIVWGER